MNSSDTTTLLSHDRSTSDGSALPRVRPSNHPPMRRRSDPGRDDAGPTTTSKPGDLRTFDSAILATRWGSTVASIALSAKFFVDADFRVIPWVVVVVAVTAIRSIAPLKDLESGRNFARWLGEFGLQLLAVVATGHWHSPLVFSLVSAIAVAAFARGFGFGFQISGAAAITITIAGFDPAWATPDSQLAVQWTTVLVLIAAVAAYGRHLYWEANEQYSATLEQVSDLTEANALLFNLHRVTQTLPASLDLEETLDSTEARLHGLINFESAAVLLVEETDGSWLVAKRRKLKLPTTMSTDQLPEPARMAIRSGETRLFTGLGEHDSTQGSFDQSSRAALYAPLLARGSLVGLLALEHSRPDAFGQRDLDVLKAMSEPVALAIDNARWFRRLRTVGADEERTRIARDLHDRIGQSLAYLAFEVDRIVHRDERGEALTQELQDLRSDLRDVIGEVRDTLYDLRSDVAAEKDFAATIEEFASRVAERSNLEVKLDCDRGPRLPILQEREMWRIAQESLINVERHADASQVTVTWTCDGSSAVLAISDNGRGFPDGHTGRIDSYGILGMRERAASVGASLELLSHPGEGTTVRCCLEQD